jgi:hypothetical protein
MRKSAEKCFREIMKIGLCGLYEKRKRRERKSKSGDKFSN